MLYPGDRYLFTIDDINTLPRRDSVLDKYPVSLSFSGVLTPHHITISNHTTTTTGKQLSFSSLARGFTIITQIYIYIFLSPLPVGWVESLSWNGVLDQWHVIEIVTSQAKPSNGEIDSITRLSQVLHCQDGLNSLPAPRRVVWLIASKCWMFTNMNFAPAEIFLNNSPNPRANTHYAMDYSSVWADIEVFSERFRVKTWD